jgi:hypothetical protein
MTRHCAGNGLIVAGIVVTVIGLAVAGMAMADLPGYWTTAVVGGGLLLAGMLRRAIGREGARGGDR